MMLPASRKEAKVKAAKDRLPSEKGGKRPPRALLLWAIGLAFGISIGLLATVLLIPSYHNSLHHGLEIIDQLLHWNHV